MRQQHSMDGILSISASSLYVVSNYFATMFKKDNPKFSVDKFFLACHSGRKPKGK